LFNRTEFLALSQRDEIDQAHLRGGPDAAHAVAETFAEHSLHPDVEREIATMLQGVLIVSTTKVQVDRGLWSRRRHAASYASLPSKCRLIAFCVS